MCGSCPTAWEGWAVTTEAEHRERDQGLGGVEAEGTSGEQPDAGVDGLDQGVREAVLQGDQDGVDVVADGVAEALEGVDAGVPGPVQPELKEVNRLLEGKLEDEAEVLLQQVGTEQRLVDALDPVQLADLLVGEVLGVLPECPAGALELPCVQVITSSAGIVPDLTSDLIQSPGRPGHDMEGIEADDGVGAAKADDLGDPGGTVGTDVRDPQGAAPAQGAEEAVERLLISAFGRPDQTSAVVI